MSDIELKPQHVFDEFTDEMMDELIDNFLSCDLIFNKKFDEIFKTNLCKVKTQKERCEVFKKYYNSDPFGKFLFKYFVIKYWSKHLRHSSNGYLEKYFASKLQNEKFYEKFNIINDEFDD